MSNIDGQSINNKPTLVNDSMDIDTINKDNEGTSSSRLNDTSSQLIHVPTASVNVLSTENRSDFAIQPTKPEEKQTNSTTINMTTQNVFQSVGKDCTTVSPDKKDECSNKELPENIEDKCDFSKQEIVTNPESVQEEIVTFLDKVVVETPSSLFPKDFDVPNDRMEVHSSHPDNSNALVAQPSSEKSVEPDYQPVSTELAILPKSSTEQSSQNNNDNMDTDETPNVQYDKDDVVRSKSADHSEVPQNTNPSGNQSRGDCGQGSQNPSNTIESESSLDGSTHPDNSSEHNNARENRRWRGRRSPSSQIDNEKSDRKSPFNLPKLSDAEFQALPSGSRLFLGNLSTHSTSKKELYDIFSPHGKILQISIKNSFGFVQYDNPESVKRAIEKENGRNLHGLEVSHGKPWHHSSSSQEEGFGKHSFANRQGKHWNQKGYKDSWYQNDRDYTPTRGNHGQPYQERRYDDYDRRSSEYKFDRRASYDSRGGYDYSDQRDYRPPHYKDENEYRPPRDERKYRRNSYREGGHRDERYSHRSKPYKIPPRDYVEKRQSRDPYRSQSHDEPDDEFPLPRRQGGDVPECQIIVLEEVERNFLWQVEGSFREASISVHTLHLSRKLQIQSVIRQMIMEGVHAVIFMERHLALNGLVNMQIFDQSRTGDNVKYDEYNGIKVEEAVGLLLRTRVSQRTGDLRPSENVMVGGQQNLQQAQQPHAMGGQAGSAGLHPISLNNVNFAALASLLGTLQPTANPSLGIQPMSIIPPGGIQTSQPGLLAQQQPPNIDVQQLLRQLAPQNPGLPNQTPFMAVPPHIASNLGLPPSSFNASLVGHPSNVITPNTISPNGLPLSQHQPPHLNPNIPQFPTPISNPSNVTDLMAQFKQYSNQR